jgi:Ca2+-transporting ATPase
MKDFFSYSITDTLKSLQARPDGLDSSEVNARRKKTGRNRLPEEKPESIFAVFLRQFQSILVYIILGAMVISFSLGHHNDAIFIVIVLLINAAVGTLQEYRAERTLLLLQKTVELRARVVRNSRKEEVAAPELVPGDIIVLEAGDKVPADARLIEARGLEVNEAALTGESMTVGKDVQIILPERTPLAERKNMVYTGTLIERGSAKAIVTATGFNTEIGKIAQILKETERPTTPLQKKLSRTSRQVGVGVLSVIAVLVAIGYLRGDAFAEIFVTSLALAVSAIPEGLPIVITVILAVGMRRLLSQNALVKKLNVAETLGSTTVICTDKTGTLTLGEMQVSTILTGGRDLLFDGKRLNQKFDHNGVESHIVALKIALLTTSAFVENPHEELEKWIVRGKHTDRALLLAALQAGLDKERIEKDLPLIAELPFDPALKISASLRKKNDKNAVLYVIGAPETVIADSHFIDVDGAHQAIQSDAFRLLQEKSDALAGKGLRILACAYRNCTRSDAEIKSIPDLLHDLTFVGFIAIKDPVRQEAKEALRLTKDAGIKTVIVTGDHRYTALAVAEELGMPVKTEEILEGKDVDGMLQETLQERAKTVRIYARVSPHHKIRIVEALRANGEVVAMVGDGVNDAPSLHGADIGVAVGSGTEIAKEAADMVILDGNFNTLVKAVEQGRLIFENIRKVIVYLLADDFSEIFILGFAILLGLPLPLLPSQILFINLVEDTLPAAALVFGKEKTETLMRQKPRGLKEPIFTKAYLKWLVAIFFIGGPALLSFFPILKLTGDVEFSRTFIFALTAIDSLIFAFVVSSLHRPVIRFDIFSNIHLVASLFFGLGMIAAAVYMPLLQRVLDTVPLEPNHWFLILGISAAELILLEVAKYWFLGKRLRTMHT